MFHLMALPARVGAFFAVIAARLALIPFVPSVLLATALLAATHTTVWHLHWVLELAELARLTPTGTGLLL